MGAVVLDASVVIALLDPRDVHHESAARAVRELADRNTDFLVPTSCLAEVLVGFARNDAELDRIESLIRDAFGEPVPLDAAVAREAARLRARHRALRLPHAIVLATGSTHEADVILTADERWKRIDHRVRVL